MRLKLELLRSTKTKRAAAMLVVITFVLLLNCFPAIEFGDSENKAYEYVIFGDGLIKGHIAADGDYLAFLGIPYAAPPTGKNRFKDPQPPPPLPAMFDATRQVKCPQRGEGDEDCLILNIFTPSRSTRAHLPVLVYIHGGSFLLGSGPTQGMEPLIKHNMIVVTLNYRLGVLGFLCLGIEDAPGNAGLKDQVAALRWVNNHIKRFGGDPSRITLYGMSAGAASVEYLILSKTTKGLFTNAIIESGSVTSVWAVDPDPVKTARDMAAVLKYPQVKTTQALFEFYKHEEAYILSDMNYLYYNNLTDGSFGFVPCVERRLKKAEAFITDPPLKLLNLGVYDNIPVIFIFANLEGLFLRSAEYAGNSYKKRMERNFLDFMPADLIFDKDKFRNEAVQNVKRLYFGKGFGVMEYLRYFGDYLVLHGLLYSVEAHATFCNKVYVMEFAYKGDLGGWEAAFEDLNMAGHGDAVKYVILKGPPLVTSDQMTVRRMTNLVANFMKNSNPTPSTTSLLPVLWPAVKAGNVTYLHMDTEFRVGHNPYEERMTLWDRLYTKFRRPVKPVDPNSRRKSKKT